MNEIERLAAIITGIPLATHDGPVTLTAIGAEGVVRALLISMQEINEEMALNGMIAGARADTPQAVGRATVKAIWQAIIQGLLR